MTRRSVERDCAKSLLDAKPDSIRLNNPEFSGRRSVRRRHCLEAASLVSRNGYAPDKRGNPAPSLPPFLSLSPRPHLRGNSSLHCLQHQKPNSLPSHNLPYSYFRLQPLPMLSLKSEGTLMPIPRKPLSDKQLAANRANAAQSTGPRSPEGKSRSAQNSRKHGFTASTFAVVRLEELDEVARLREDLIAVYQPVNSQELFAVERIALAQQALTLFLRYQAQTERLYRRAIEEFDRLKARRHELPNEPILDTQPEANETVNTPEPNPANPGNPPKPPSPTPAGNIQGQPKRFRPNGEPDRK